MTSTRPRTFAQIRKAEAQAAAVGTRVPIKKADLPTFLELAGRSEFAEWLPRAIEALSATISSAVYAEDADGSLTPEVRAAAAIAAVDAFRAALLDRTAQAIVQKHRGHQRWAGWL